MRYDAPELAYENFANGSFTVAIPDTSMVRFATLSDSNASVTVTPGTLYNFSTTVNMGALTASNNSFTVKVKKWTNNKT